MGGIVSVQLMSAVLLLLGFIVSAQEIKGFTSKMIWSGFSTHVVLEHEGKLEGIAEGTEVGRIDGENDGLIDGILDGLLVGNWVGFKVGKDEGTVDGNGVGNMQQEMC